MKLIIKKYQSMYIEYKSKTTIISERKKGNSLVL